MLKEINDKKAFLHNNNDHSNQNEMAPDRWWLEKNDEWCVWISFPLDANTNEFYFWREVRFLPRSLLLFFYFDGIKSSFSSFLSYSFLRICENGKSFFSPPEIGWMVGVRLFRHSSTSRLSMIHQVWSFDKKRVEIHFVIIGISSWRHNRLNVSGIFRVGGRLKVWDVDIKDFALLLGGSKVL